MMPQSMCNNLANNSSEYSTFCNAGVSSSMPIHLPKEQEKTHRTLDTVFRIMHHQEENGGDSFFPMNNAMNLLRNVK
jgi:hypothetical protein